jgi:hypothetical protein
MTQASKFIAAARAADCNDDEAAFNANLKAIAQAPPPKSEPKPKTKKPAK